MFFYYDDDNRFYEIQAEDIEEWKRDERDLLPAGVVFRPSISV